MDRARRNALGDLRHKDNRAPVVEGANEISLRDASGSRIFGTYANDPVVVSVNENPVVFDVVGPRIFAVPHGMEREARVRAYEL
jgi:hypothetical protein